MKQTVGNLLDLADAGEFDVIIHGCNCMNTFGAGIARQIAIRHPRAKEVDSYTKYGDKGKLGTWTLAEVNFYNEHIGKQVNFMVINAYTQYDWRKKKGEIAADYNAIEKVFKDIAVSFNGLKIGYPMIGAGLAGGDWDTIKGIIDSALYQQDHYLVTLS